MKLVLTDKEISARNVQIIVKHAGMASHAKSVRKVFISILTENVISHVTMINITMKIERSVKAGATRIYPKPVLMVATLIIKNA